MQVVGVPNLGQVSGGMVLGNPTFLASFPAQGSAPNLYGTVFFNGNFSPTITIDFTARVTRVSGVLFNGLTDTADYVVEAFNGPTVVNTVFLDNVPENFDPNGFANWTVMAPSITRVQIHSEDQQTFDFLVDNIAVTFVPEPSSVILLGTGSLAVLVLTRRRPRVAARTRRVAGKSPEGGPR
jgi:hypothetical protein